MPDLVCHTRGIMQKFKISKQVSDWRVSWTSQLPLLITPYKWWSSPDSDLKVCSIVAEVSSYVHLGILKHAGAGWSEIMGSDFEMITVIPPDFTLAM